MLWVKKGLLKIGFPNAPQLPSYQLVLSSSADSDIVSRFNTVLVAYADFPIVLSKFHTYPKHCREWSHNLLSFQNFRDVVCRNSSPPVPDCRQHSSLCRCWCRLIKLTLNFFILQNLSCINEPHIRSRTSV